MKNTFSLSHLVVVGLLVASPAVAFAQQPATPEQAAKSGGRTYTGGRHHEDAAATAVPITAKSINEKGIKKTEAPPAALAVVPPAGTGKSISEKGVKKTEASPAALIVAPPAGAGKGHNEKGIK